MKKACFDAVGGCFDAVGGCITRVAYVVCIVGGDGFRVSCRFRVRSCQLLDWGVQLLVWGIYPSLGLKMETRGAVSLFWVHF